MVRLGTVVSCTLVTNRSDWDRTKRWSRRDGQVDRLQARNTEDAITEGTCRDHRGDRKAITGGTVGAITGSDILGCNRGFHWFTAPTTEYCCFHWLQGTSGLLICTNITDYWTVLIIALNWFLFSTWLEKSSVALVTIIKIKVSSSQVIRFWVILRGKILFISSCKDLLQLILSFCRNAE